MIIPANETFLVNNLIRDEIISANYKVANLIPSQLPFVTNTIMIYYFPIFSKREKDPQLWQLIKKVGKYTALINILIVMVGIGITPLIIRIAYGDSYIDTAYMSNLLWGVYLINAGFRMIPMNILPALGYIKFNVIISIFSSLIHLCIDYLMIKHYGINGAVITTAITYLVTGLLYWIYVYRKCKEKLKYA